MRQERKREKKKEKEMLVERKSGNLDETSLLVYLNNLRILIKTDQMSFCTNYLQSNHQRRTKLLVKANPFSIKPKKL
jgi:hypothetical protein